MAQQKPQSIARTRRKRKAAGRGKIGRRLCEFCKRSS
jgi:hypothetical protein